MHLAEVTFDPEQRPESQHQLRGIPESSLVEDRVIKAALKTYEAARAEELARRQDFVQAEIELGAAQFRDEQALAAAKSAKKPDKGPVEEEKQLALIRECRRQHGASKILLGQAVDGVKTAFEENGDRYEKSLLADRDHLRGAMGEILDGWVRLHGNLQRNSAMRSVMRGSNAQAPSLFADSIKVPRVRDGDVVWVADVISGLRGLAEPQKPRNAVQNVPLGHVPPGRQGFTSSGSQSVPLGRASDPERVKEWVEADEREAALRAGV